MNEWGWAVAVWFFAVGLMFGFCIGYGYRRLEERQEVDDGG